MPMLDKWAPIREMDRMERRMRRLFADTGLFPLAVPVPASDVYETDDELIVELEVPGFDESELDVEVVDHTLVVRGTREEHEETQRKEMILRERLEREFERRFDLPPATDGEHVTAGFAKGVLTLHVPKTDAAQPRKVRISRD